MVKINELQIVELLQYKMAGIEQQIAAGVILYPVEEHLDGSAIMQIFSGMNLETQIHSRLVKGIQYGQPAGSQLIECGLDQSGGPLRPGINIGPGQRS